MQNAWEACVCPLPIGLDDVNGKQSSIGFSFLAIVFLGWGINDDGSVLFN